MRLRRRILKRLATVGGAIAAAFAVREVPDLAGMESDLAELSTQVLLLGGAMLVPLESRAPKDEAD